MHPDSMNRNVGEPNMDTFQENVSLLWYLMFCDVWDPNLGTFQVMNDILKMKMFLMFCENISIGNKRYKN